MILLNIILEILQMKKNMTTLTMALMTATFIGITSVSVTADQIDPDGYNHKYDNWRPGLYAPDADGFYYKYPTLDQIDPDGYNHKYDNWRPGLYAPDADGFYYKYPTLDQIDPDGYNHKYDNWRPGLYGPDKDGFSYK
ncbi:hypothetical protein NX86_01815 [Streptococcus phocae subsp. salmonis]|nr:hypothetical protein NX86_01815 [Streptococcus phocae subsp. salmonis]